MGRYLYILLMLLYVTIAASYVIPCKGLVCMHGGNCTISPFGGEPYCKCSPMFYGITCDMIKVNPCEVNKCMNFAVCNVTKDYDSYTCECQNGYAGEFCEVKINFPSAADMLAADSSTETFNDATKKSSNSLLYIIIAVIGIFVLFALLINIVAVRKRKFVAFRSVFVPPTSDELSKRQNMHQKRHYGNQFDRQSLIGDAAANTVYIPGLDNSVSSIEPAAKRFREEQPIPIATPIQHDRIFTELHQHAASAEPISDEHIPRLIPCAKVVDSDGRSCIHWAIECVSDKLDSQVIEDIKKLVSIGCPIDAQDDSGATALHLAVRNGRTEVATYLLSKIDVNIQDDDGRTALFDAVSTKSLEMVQNILKVQNVEVNAIAYTNDTSLIKCCRIDDENDMVSIAEALLKHPSIQIDKTGDKASADYNGRMAIHEAAACNSIQILKLLISRGAAVSAHDVHQQTPLFLAVQSNQTEAVKLLINQMRANKAEINSSNDCDETPLQIAISKGFTEIAELLRNAGTQMPCIPTPIEHPKYPKTKAITGPALAQIPIQNVQMQNLMMQQQSPQYPFQQYYYPQNMLMQLPQLQQQYFAAYQQFQQQQLQQIQQRFNLSFPMFRNMNQRFDYPPS